MRKSNTFLILGSLLLSLFLLFFLPVNTVKALDLVSDFNKLFCTPSSTSGTMLIKGPVSPWNWQLSIGTLTDFAGAITSLKVNSTETVSTTDRGREIQYAFQVDGGGEGNNPTEAVEPSVFLKGCKTTDKLYTFSQMGYWKQYNGLSLSPFKLEKIVKIGEFNMPNVISFKSKIHIPFDLKSINIEIPTGYQLVRFKQQGVKAYDPMTGKVRDFTTDEIVLNRWNVFPKSYSGGLIPIFWQGYAYMAAYSPMSNFFWATDEGSYVKWSLGQRISPVESDSIYTLAYLIVNTSYDAVAKDLAKVINLTTPNLKNYTVTENSYAQQLHGGITKSDGNYVFDGNTGYVEVMDYPFEGLNSVSIESVIKPNTTTIDKALVFNQANVARAVVLNDGSGSCRIATVNAAITDTTIMASWPTGKVKFDQWNHLVCVYDGTYVIAYVNGEKVGQSSAISGKVKGSGNTSLVIGKGAGTTNSFFKGQVKQVSIWRKGLTASEVLARYQNFITPTPQTTKPGDFNNDGAVNYSDYELVKQNFGSQYSVYDYNLVVANYGK